MQAVKQSLYFRHLSYEIQLNPLGQKRLSINIIDSITKSQFYEKQLTLSNIGVSTIIKAFEKSKKQIAFNIQHKKGGQFQMIQINFIVESSFLKPVSQTIYIKKNRQISQAESVKRSIDYLNKKIKDLKVSDQENKKNITFAAVNQKDKTFNIGNSFQTFSQITLEKGKYLITWTFLAKATNQLMYLYLNQGQVTLLANCAIYVPNQNYYIPFTYRKVHTVTENSQKLSLQTYCTASYPVSIKNAVVTARNLQK